MIRQWDTWTQELNAYRLRYAVELAIHSGNACAAYVYSRMLARTALDYVIPRE